MLEDDFNDFRLGHEFRVFREVSNSVESDQIALLESVQLRYMGCIEQVIIG
jgi:hypothetical protein